MIFITENKKTIADHTLQNRHPTTNKTLSHRDPLCIFADFPKPVITELITSIPRGWFREQHKN